MKEIINIKGLNECIKLGKKLLEFKNLEFQEKLNSILIEEQNKIEILKTIKQIKKLNKKRIVKDLKELNKKYTSFFNNYSLQDLEVKNYFLKTYSIDTDFLTREYLMRKQDDNSRLQLNQFILDIERLLQEEKDKDDKELTEKMCSIAEKVYTKAKEEHLSMITIPQTKRLLIELKLLEEVIEKDIKIIREIVITKLLKDIPMQKSKRIPIDKQIKKKVLERDNYTCQLNLDNNCSKTEYLEIGHKIPVSRCGTNDINNLMVQCRHCNQKLGRRTI